VKRALGIAPVDPSIPHSKPHLKDVLVIQASKATGYGRYRLSIYIEGMGQNISPYTSAIYSAAMALLKSANLANTLITLIR
jgi:hypothetical protein